MPEDQLFEKNKFAAFGSEMKPEAESEPGLVGCISVSPSRKLSAPLVIDKSLVFGSSYLPSLYSQSI